MKLIKITFLGLSIWLLTLIWPEVNLWFSPAVMLRAIIVLGSVMIGYLKYQQLRRGVLVPKRDPVPARGADTHPLKPVRIT